MFTQQTTKVSIHQTKVPTYEEQQKKNGLTM